MPKKKQKIREEKLINKFYKNSEEDKTNTNEESKTNEDRISLAFNLQVKGNYVKEFDKHD